ncbi:MAG: hypothetical protein ACOC22_02910 [bacterium]
MKKDALGNPIVIGKTYGYSRNANGLTFIRVGTITKETKEKVTLKVLYAKRGLYSDELENEKLEKEHISIKSNMLFPVDLNNSK